MNRRDSHRQRATKAMARRTLKEAPRRILINIRRSTSGAGSMVCVWRAMADTRSVSRGDFLGGTVCAVRAQQRVGGAGFPPHDRKVVLRRIRAVCLRYILQRLLLVRLAERPVPRVPDEGCSHRCTRAAICTPLTVYRPGQQPVIITTNTKGTSGHDTLGLGAWQALSVHRVEVAYLTQKNSSFRAIGGRVLACLP